MIRALVQVRARFGVETLNILNPFVERRTTYARELLQFEQTLVRHRRTKAPGKSVK